MEHWEQLCRRYTDRKGPDGRRRELPDDILMGMLQEMGPPELSTHLHLNSQKCTSHAVVRSEVVSCLEAKVGARLHKDDPMEVVTVAKEEDKGKRKGKSRDCKVKGKDNGATSGRTAGKKEVARAKTKSKAK